MEPKARQVERTNQRRAFGRALEEAIGDARITQTELARRYAEAVGGKVTPSKVSDWTRGESLPEDGDPEAIFLVERLVGAPTGSLARHLGFLPIDTTGCTVEVAVARDPHLDEADRVGLLGQYRALVAFRRG